jgi:hypothetical protein
MIPDFFELQALRAECKLRSGQDLASRLQREKAFRLWEEAKIELIHAIKPADKLQEGEREINGAMYKTLIICLDMLGEFKELRSYLQAWEREHPEDTRPSFQRDFIENKHGMTIDELATRRRQTLTTSKPYRREYDRKGRLNRP